MDRIMSVHDNLQFIEEVSPQELIIEKTAFQMLLEREVTVRYLNPAAANDPRLYAQFIKDGRTLSSLRHSNIVHVYEAGINNDNLPYLILEKPDGITANQRINQLERHRTQISIDQVLSIMSGVSEGLEYLHQQNVLLHSLSPDNIVLTKSKSAVLTSLGQPIPKNHFNSPVEMLAYASPERLFNDHTDVRSDVYSLGVLLYHLLFGKLPFKGDIYGLVAQKQNGFKVPAFQAFSTDFSGSDALRQVLCQALATGPGDRYASVGSFRTALIDVLKPKSTESRLPSNLVKSFQNGSHHSAIRPISIDPPYQNGINGNGTARKLGLPSNGKLKEEPVPSAPPDQYAVNHTLNGSSNGHHAKPVETNGQAKNEKPVSDLAAAAEENERIALDQTEISPLMPGLDNPALETAIPYTILVPMPDKTLDKPESESASPEVTLTSSNTLSKYKRTLGIVALGAMGIIAALNLG